MMRVFRTTVLLLITVSPVVALASLGTPSVSSTGGISSGFPSQLSPLKPDCNEIISNPIFRATPTNLSVLNDAECKAYADLHARYTPDPTGCSPRGWAGIAKLNPTFAENLDALLNAAPPGIKILSAYRSPGCDQENAPGSYGGNPNLSPHVRGVAADLIYPDTAYSKTTCDGTNPSSDYRAIEELSRANTYHVRLYNENGHAHITGECNHVEDSSGSTGPVASGAPPYPSYHVISPNPQTANQYPYAAPSPVNNPNSGPYSTNNGFGNMMQMMLATQVEQSFGTLFQGLFNSSPKYSSSPATQPSYNPPPQSISNTPSGTNAASGAGGNSGISSIDQLLNQLNGSSSLPSSESTSSSASIAANDIGSLDSTTTLFSDALVQPPAGIAPLTVDAHFETGVSCSDAYDLSWGDRSAHDTMAYQPPTSGSACALLAQVHDIQHTYATPGTYQVTLLRDIRLSNVSTTTVTVLATSSDMGGALGTIAIDLNNASNSLAEATSTGGVSALSSALSDLQGAFANMVVYIENLFGGIPKTP